MDAPTTLDAVEIMKIIPHRYPFLLVDRIEELEAGKRGVGIKNVSMGDPFFQGHFPDFPVMPGVLIVEALAQVGAVAMLTLEEYRGKIAFFAGIDNVRFKRQVKPGDTLLVSGTCNENIDLGEEVHGITLDGQGTATINGDPSVVGPLHDAVASDHGIEAIAPAEIDAEAGVATLIAIHFWRVRKDGGISQPL